MLKRLTLISSLATATLLIGACDNSPSPDPQEGVEGRAELTDDGDNLPPEGVGDPIKAIALQGFRTPKVELDDRLAGKDRQDLQVLVDSAVALIIRPELAGTGAQVAAQYPRVRLRTNLNDRTSEEVAKLVANPLSNWSYLSTRVNLTNDGAVTGPNGRATPHALRVLIPRSRLRMWRSKNRVEQSCALNTTAHEISHTLVSSTSRFFPVFSDSGPSSHVQRSFASYLTGNMAQCTFLRLTHRIDNADITKCVPAWTGWSEKRQHVYFRAGICDRFNATEPVGWPKT